MPHYVRYDELPSTNTLMKQQAPTLPHATVIYTPKQTAGRGQKGNTWHAQPGMNATFSMLLKRLDIRATQQFVINEAVTLAIVDALAAWLPDGLAVKWPNDIYHGDSKLCGLLIEHSLDGAMIDYSVVGIGINVNQREWGNNAPNPTSLALITGQQANADEVMQRVCDAIEATCHAGLDSAMLHERYLSRLSRNDGNNHPWRLPDGTQFDASIAGVAPDGTLTLRHADGTLHDYAFQQVKHIINNNTL